MPLGLALVSPAKRLHVGLPDRTPGTVQPPEQPAIAGWLASTTKPSRVPSLQPVAGAPPAPDDAAVDDDALDDDALDDVTDDATDDDATDDDTTDDADEANDDDTATDAALDDTLVAVSDAALVIDAALGADAAPPAPAGFRPVSSLRAPQRVASPSSTSAVVSRAARPMREFYLTSRAGTTGASLPPPRRRARGRGWVRNDAPEQRKIELADAMRSIEHIDAAAANVKGVFPKDYSGG